MICHLCKSRQPISISFLIEVDMSAVMWMLSIEKRVCPVTSRLFSYAERSCSLGAGMIFSDCLVAMLWLTTVTVAPVSGRASKVKVFPCECMNRHGRRGVGS